MIEGLPERDYAVLIDRLNRFADIVRFTIYKNGIVLYVEDIAGQANYAVCIGRYENPSLILDAILKSDEYQSHLNGWHPCDDYGKESAHHNLYPPPSQEAIERQSAYAFARYIDENVL